jgi:hypothetical protein
MIVFSKSTLQFQSFIKEEYNKLIEKRRQYFLSMYEKLIKINKNHPLVDRFFKLIHEDIESLELLSIAYQLSNVKS